ncbi:diacylglycerol kinase (ATP) [Paragonimus westermani]|uniref:Diacylglycerol kinase n=1 Tax=Paragonimus westermani TaxID=34504 RepID=A0A5J4NU15_9TREM|nr:diacylglycerol kinase (ATP) [Paragonimus westermani]
MRKPLLVFINPKSGGNQGLSLLRKFQWMLNPRQVFDLSQGGPRMGLELFNRVPNLRVLVCGGDGTVGWVFSTIDELELSPPPPVAVLPLGTGNDLARTLHWGSGYTDEPKSKILRSVANGEIIALDRWHVDCEQRSDLLEGASSAVMADDEDGRSIGLVRTTLPLTVFNNYFSLGADAATALEFHECREANPEKFTSRLKNKMFYAGCGGKDLLRRCWRDLSEHITLVCDGKDMTPLIRSLRPHVILFLNIPKYGSGTLPWGHAPATAGFKPPRIDDGLLEVIGLSSTTLALLQVGGHGDRICQCREVTLTTDKVIPVQMDGEPCRLLPAKVEIRCSHQALVVEKRGRRSSSLSRNNSKDFLEKRGTCGYAWLHIFVISLRDYEAIAEDALVLRHLAAYYGSISVTFEATVSKMRRTVEAFNDLFDPVAATETDQHEDKRAARSEKPLFRLSNSWLFVDSTTAASRFFRIDSMRESVHFITDICNMEELFLIDNQMDSRLVQQKSAENQVTAKTETPVMNEPTLIGSCKTKQAEQIGLKLDGMYDGNSNCFLASTVSDQSPSNMEPVNSKDAIPCEKIEEMRVTSMQPNNVGSLNSTHAPSVMNQQVEQTVSEATDSSSLKLLRGSLDDTHLIRSRRRLIMKDDEEQSSAVRDWLNLEVRQLSYSSSRSGQTSVVDLTGSDTEGANQQTERAQRSSVCLISADYEDDEASFQARLNKGEF